MYKKIIWFVGLWLMPLLLLAEVNNISISGEVLNAKDRQVQVVLYTFVPGEEDHASTTELNANNNFQFVAYIREPMYGRIFYGKDSATVFVQPGTQLQISFDAKDFNKTLKFKGDGAVDNNFLTQHYLTYELGSDAIREKVKKKSPQEFSSWAKQRYQEQQAAVNAKSKALSPTFVTYQQANLEYQWANELFAYAQAQDTGKKKSKLPATYFSFIDEVKLHNYDVISLESYRSFLTNYLKHLYTQTHKIQPEKNKEYFNHMYELAANNLRSLPKYHMQAVYLVEAISSHGLDAVKDEYIEFANECPVQPYKNELHELIKMQNVFEVKEKPKVVFKGKDGRDVPLSLLKGKIVLVRFDNDVQTTADPAEVKKHDELLKKQLASFKDVQFLQLSMQENRDAYERMVYADANDYLKSIINRPKPGQKVQLPAWSYVVLNREGLVVSNSLDDPNNELAIEKIKVILQQEDSQVAADQP